jgi:hypothetical protein
MQRILRTEFEFELPLEELTDSTTQRMLIVLSMATQKLIRFVQKIFMGVVVKATVVL